MIAAIHQPHFLPWLGYFDRMAKADLFIVLDHVQFERGGYQNRVQIKNGGDAGWLTVPICHRSRLEPITSKLVDNHEEGSKQWGRRLWQTLRAAYQGAPFFDLYGPGIQDVLEGRWERLVDLDLHFIEMLRRGLGIHTPLVRSSELGVDGHKSDLIAGLCKAVGADTFLGGTGGSRHYLDRQAMEQAGISVVWQEFRHPTYVQYPGPEKFVSGLSAVDLLFNCGPHSRDVLLEGREMAYAGDIEVEAAD